MYSDTTAEHSCVFLNGTDWVSDGLTTEAGSNTTNCKSKHLTSFAVFVNPQSTPSSILDFALSIVSYIAIGISFLALVISLILFIVGGKAFFKKDTNIIYFNYCLSMLFATGTFGFGIQVGAYNIIACKVIAFLLHYSWLAVVTWTLCIGIATLHKLFLSKFLICYYN